jgi:hypothetical protein
VAQQPERDDGDSSGINPAELEKVCTVIRSGHSALVLGETGTAVDAMPRAIAQALGGELDCAMVVYKGSGKLFFQQMARALDIPVTEPKLDGDGEEVGEKGLTLEQLKEEILMNVGGGTLLVLPEARRLTTGIRYWLEDAIAAGVRVCCFAAANPGRDIFLSMIEVELEMPTDAYIRIVMAAEAQRQGLQMTEAQLAALQPLAGRNPMLARKVVQREKLGIKNQSPEHTQYIVIMPVVIALLFSFAVLRFIGMGTGNKALYLVGGVSLVVAMALKQLGQVKGARKRLGQ